MNPCDLHRQAALLSIYDGEPTPARHCAACDAFVADARRIRGAYGVAGAPRRRRLPTWLGAAAAAVLLGLGLATRPAEAPVEPVTAAVPPVAAPVRVEPMTMIETTVRVRGGGLSMDAVIDSHIRSLRGRIEAVSGDFYGNRL